MHSGLKDNRIVKFFTSNIVVVMIVAPTLLHWVVLGFKIPILANLPGWFWRFIPKSTGPAWLVGLLLAVSVIVVAIIIAVKGRYRFKLLLLFLLGAGLQFGFAFLEERGLDAIRDRMVETGHAEFAIAAVQRDDLFYVASNYESLLESGELGEYANSKPPGTLQFYMLTDKLAGFYPADDSTDEDADLERLRNVASILWPVLSYLVLIPIFCYAGIVFNRPTAILACTLYLFVPSVNLVTLHTDQVIYPFLFMMSILLSAIASKKNSRLLGLCAGIFIYCTIWFTFPLIFTLPFVLVSCCFLSKQCDSGSQWRSFLRVITAIATGIVLADIVFRLCFNYDILLRYRNAIGYHAAWKDWTSTFIETIYFAILNLIEYGAWIGIPLFLLLVSSFLDSVTEYRMKRKVTLESLQPIVLVGTLMFIALVGKTKGEVARLWLFLVPYVCLVVARTILTRFQRLNPWFIEVVVVLQFGTTYFTKVNQDFW